MTGHVASKCSFSIESQTDNIEDSNEPKKLIRSNSTEKLIDNVNNHIKSARNIIENNKDLNINLNQLKNILINIQGN
jgi:hypothetical protein